MLVRTLDGLVQRGRATLLRVPECTTRCAHRCARVAQITAEQILRESRELQEQGFKAPTNRITDVTELNEYRLRKRKEFEDLVRRVRWNMSVWVKVPTCTWLLLGLSAACRGGTCLAAVLQRCAPGVRLRVHLPATGSPPPGAGGSLPAAAVRASLRGCARRAAADVQLAALQYAQWEEGQKDFRRARSVWERALEVSYTNPATWLKCAWPPAARRLRPPPRHVRGVSVGQACMAPVRMLRVLRWLLRPLDRACPSPPPAG